MNTKHAAMVAAGMMAAVAPAMAQPHEHAEVQVGRDAAGVLHMHTHDAMPFHAEPSELPGFDGHVNIETAFASIPSDHGALGLFMLDPTADIRAVYVGGSPELRIFDGLNRMDPGEEMVLGSPVIHYLPVWNIVGGVEGQVYSAQFMFRDASGLYLPSETFTLTFTPVPAPAGAAALGAAGLWLFARRRR